MRAQTADDRAARAREALRAAEQRTGARTLSMLRDASAHGAQTVSAPAASLPATSAQAAPASVGVPVQDETRPAASLKAVDTLVSTERPPLPVDAALAPLLPDGLRRGIVVQVDGSTSVVLALLAQASREGAWSALVGAPSVGLLAAAEAGIELSRLVLVPAPGPQSASAIAALLDGMDVVVAGPDAVLLDVDRRRLVARARERASVVVAMRPWAGAHMTLRTESSTWSGLGAGRGRLRSRELVLSRTDRSRGGPPVQHTVRLPFEAPAPLVLREENGTATWIGATAQDGDSAQQTLPLTTLPLTTPPLTPSPRMPSPLSAVPNLAQVG